MKIIAVSEYFFAALRIRQEISLTGISILLICPPTSLTNMAIKPPLNISLQFMEFFSA